ncbi:Arc family DNA-binding protein [Hafnia alvei]|nr:Arc family DNA-binding protein [Hafnia alvei]MCE9874076.1 Arc family DNA-binding protein [Hafnia alvei]
MTDKENPAFVERFTVRMPDGLRDAIAERAKVNGRSMNSEIVQILQDAISGKDTIDKDQLDMEKIKTILDRVAEEVLGNKKPT